MEACIDSYLAYLYRLPDRTEGGAQIHQIAVKPSSNVRRWAHINRGSSKRIQQNRTSDHQSATSLYSRWLHGPPRDTRDSLLIPSPRPTRYLSYAAIMYARLVRAHIIDTKCHSTGVINITDGYNTYYTICYNYFKTSFLENIPVKLLLLFF